MLTGVASQFGGGSHYQRTPRRPLLEVGHRMVGEVRLQHVSDCFRVEHPAARDQENAAQWRLRSCHSDLCACGQPLPQMPEYW
jgi:hypothetical protein